MNNNEGASGANGDVRCHACHKLLAKQDASGAFVIKCPRCHAFVPILERIGRAIMLVDEQAQILCVNRGFEELSGYLRDELIGYTLTDDMSLETCKELFQRIGVAEPTVVRIPHCRRKNEPPIDIIARVIPLVGSQKEKPVYVIGAEKADDSP